MRRAEKTRKFCQVLMVGRSMVGRAMYASTMASYLQQGNRRQQTSPRCCILTNSTRYNSSLTSNCYGVATCKTSSKHDVFRDSAHWSHSMTGSTWRIAKQSEEERPTAACTNSGEVRLRGFRIIRAERRTDGRTYFVTTLRNPNGGEVITEPLVWSHA